MIPYGYRITDGKAEPDPVESRRLMKFFAVYVDGGMITASAEAAGIDRSASCCRSMLTNPVYLGNDDYPPLISPEIMRLAADRAERRSAHLRGIGHKNAARPIPVRTCFVLDADACRKGAHNVRDAVTLYRAIRAVTEN